MNECNISKRAAKPPHGKRQPNWSDRGKKLVGSWYDAWLTCIFIGKSFLFEN